MASNTNVRASAVSPATPQLIASEPLPRVVAIIPAYNEDKHIGSVVLKARREVDQVVVVDDGSTDLTGILAADAGAIVLPHATNRGKGAAIRSGLRWAASSAAEAVVLLDGDGQHRPEEIRRLVGPVLLGEADIVVGSRFIGEAALATVPRWRVLGQQALNTATRLGSGYDLTDSQSGFRVFSRRAVLLMYQRLRSNGFSTESEMQFVAGEHGLRTVELPIVAEYNHLPLKRNPVVHGMQVLNGVLQLAGQSRPLLLIGLPGLIILALGIVLGLDVVSIFSDTHQLAIGYSLVTILLILLGTLALFCGIMLHSIRALLLNIREPA